MEKSTNLLVTIRRRKNRKRWLRHISCQHCGREIVVFRRAFGCPYCGYLNDTKQFIVLDSGVARKSTRRRLSPASPALV